MSDDLKVSRFGWFSRIQRPEGGRAKRKAIAAKEFEAGAALWLGQLRAAAIKRTGKGAV